MNEREFHATVVRLILNGQAEHALKSLAEWYGVSEPSLRVGTVKRFRKALGCYVDREKRIYLSTSEFLTDPFVILHEFYHHLRASRMQRARQVEKRADLFALNYVRDFKRFSAQLGHAG